jgi:hypothetical protein
MYSIPGTNVCMVHHNGSLANWKTVYDTAHQPSCSYAYHQPVHGTTYQPRSYAYEESGNGTPHQPVRLVMLGTRAWHSTTQQQNILGTSSKIPACKPIRHSGNQGMIHHNSKAVQKQGYATPHQQGSRHSSKGVRYIWI